MRVLDISDSFETASSPTAETGHIKLGDDGLAVTDTEAKFLILEHSLAGYLAFRTPNSVYKGLLFNEGTNGDGAYFRYVWTGTASTSLYEWRGNDVELMTLSASGVLSAAIDGSNSTPSYTFTQGTTVGLFRAGAGLLGLAGRVMLGADGSSVSPIFAFNNEGSLGLYRDASGVIGLAGALKILSSSGPQLKIEDGGAFGTNADPYITFSDGSVVGAQIGYTGAASNDFIVNQTITAGSLLLQHDETTRIEINSTGIGVFTATPIGKQTITGVRDSNTALANLLTALASFGWITDSTTAT